MNEEHTCCRGVHNPNGSWGNKYRKCGKSAKFDRDGEWYCGIHDPVKRKEKRDRRYAEFKEKLERDQKLFKLEQCAPDLLAALKGLVEPYNGFSTRDIEKRCDPATFLRVMGAFAAIAKAEGRTP